MAATCSVAGTEVPAVGLGGARLSLGAHRPDERLAIRTVHAALDRGVRLIDTADVYCPGAGAEGHNERLLARALQSWSGDSDQVLVVTKGGQHWEGSEARFDGSPARLRAACEASLVALGVGSIALYLLHRLPGAAGAAALAGRRLDELAASLGTLAALRAEGKVRSIGLSNVSVAELEALGSDLPELAALENPCSPALPGAGAEIAWCAERSAAFLAWSPLAGIKGASATRPPATLAPSPLGEALVGLARERGISLQRAALAWLLARSPRLVALVGSTRPETVLDSFAATELVLAPDELEALGLPDEPVTTVLRTPGPANRHC